MLTGRAPFARSGGMAAAAAAHLTEPPPRATDVVATLPTALDGVIVTAMAKEPSQRYQTALDLAHAAARALDESTDAVRRTPRLPVAPSWPSEHSAVRSTFSASYATPPYPPPYGGSPGGGAPPAPRSNPWVDPRPHGRCRPQRDGTGCRSRSGPWWCSSRPASSATSR